MKVFCMHCGHPIDLGRGYDNYQGPLRCAVCKRLMTVRITVGELRAMEIEPVTVPSALSHPPPTIAATPPPATSAVTPTQTTVKRHERQLQSRPPNTTFETS